eukprot:352869-Chlamydomonas_euryale.AAC.11
MQTSLNVGATGPIALCVPFIWGPRSCGNRVPQARVKLAVECGAAQAAPSWTASELWTSHEWNTNGWSGRHRLRHRTAIQSPHT